MTINTHLFIIVSNPPSKLNNSDIIVEQRMLVVGMLVHSLDLYRFLENCPVPQALDPDL